MKVLVVGGTGSISREIVAELIARGHDTTVFNRGLREAALPHGVRTITGDRTDRASFERALGGEGFDAVIDMIAYNPEDAESTLRALRGRAGQLIFTSSVACSKRPFRRMPPIREEEVEYVDDPANGYGYNKGRMERYLIERFSEAPITIVRPSLTFGRGGNNIGIFRQNFGLVKRMRDGKRVVLFGDGESPMNFTFTPDIARGYAAILGNRKAYGRIYHLVSDEYSTWNDLYRAIGNAAGADPEIVHLPTELLVAAAPKLNAHLYDDKHWVNLFDSSKARQDLDFRPHLALESGFRWILEWYDGGHDTAIKADVDRFEDELVELYDRFKAEISGRLS